MRLHSIRLRGPGILGLSALVCAALCAAACGPAEVGYEVVETPSGAELKIEEFGETPRANGELALLLRYRTDLDLSDAKALEREVAVVWDYLRPRVEARGLRVAVIQAAHWEPPSWERQGAAAQYVVKRSSDGSWGVHANEPGGDTS